VCTLCVALRCVNGSVRTLAATKMHVMPRRLSLLHSACPGPSLRYSTLFSGSAPRGSAGTGSDPAPLRARKLSVPATIMESASGRQSRAHRHLKIIAIALAPQLSSHYRVLSALSLPAALGPVPRNCALSRAVRRHARADDERGWGARALSPPPPPLSVHVWTRGSNDMS